MYELIAKLVCDEMNNYRCIKKSIAVQLRCLLLASVAPVQSQAGVEVGETLTILQNIQQQPCPYVNIKQQQFVYFQQQLHAYNHFV